MKKLIFILAAFLLIPGIVNAEYFPGVEMPSDVYTLNNNGSSATDGKHSSFIDSPNWFYNYYQLYSYNYQTNGIFIQFPLKQGIEQNNRYIIQVYLNGTYSMKQGKFSKGFALTNYVNSNPFNYLEGVNLKSFICESTTAYIGSSDSQLTVCTIDFIFTKSYNPKFISVPINSNTSGVQNVQFLGYTLQNLGKDYETDLNNIKTSIGDISNNINNVKDDINNSIKDSNDQINNSINSMGDAINQNINDQFNSCHESKNLAQSVYTSTYTGQYYGAAYVKFNLKPSTNYVISFKGTVGNRLHTNDNLFKYVDFSVVDGRTIVKVTSLASLKSDQLTSNGWLVLKNSKNNSANVFDEFMIQEGTQFTSYEAYGEKVCTNRLDDQIANENKNHEEAQETRKGILGTIQSLFTSIVELPSKLVNLLLDGLKSLFIPTEEQMKDVLSRTSDLAANFGFVGQTVDFLMNIISDTILTSQGIACVELPELTIKFSEMANLNIDDFTIWKAQDVCMNQHPWLGRTDIITPIRTITTLGLLVLFIRMAKREYDYILSKENSKSQAPSESGDS